MDETADLDKFKPVEYYEMTPHELLENVYKQW